VDVQHAAFVVLHEPWAEDAHEPGENQQLGLPLVEFSCNGPVESLSIPVCAMLDASCGYAGLLCTLQTVGFRSVAEDDR